MKILLGALIAIVVLLVGVELWLGHRFSQVDFGLRLIGWIYSIVNDFDDMDGLHRFADRTNRPKPWQANFPSARMTVKIYTIQGRDGNEIPVSVYTPRNAKPNASGILWLHGGGYVIGSPTRDRRFFAPLVKHTNTVAVVPDYRHSDVAPYPAAFHDCCDALLWMKAHARELGINPDQLFLGGCSAGGGMTAALAIYARDSGLVNIAFQMPIYPMLNDRMDTPSMIGCRSLIWNEDQIRLAWQLYLDDLYGNDDVPVYAAPAREKDLHGLPPAYTFVGGLDGLYDETMHYVHGLEACGIAVKCDVYDAAFHGFDAVPSLIALRARKKLLKEYKFAVAHYYAPQKAEDGSAKTS